MAQESLTINEAAETTGWSPRMLRYIESIGLVVPDRSPSGYRLYGAAQLQRLRTLRELLDDHGVALGEVGFARRLRDDRALATAVEGWLDARPERPDDITPADWLRHEQDKHTRLLRLAASPSTN
jgi:MerR family transcriptional regulator, copper efflux regulator